MTVSNAAPSSGDLMHLMEIALGDPPNQYPRGCVQLLAGCFKRIPPNDFLILGAPARRLFTKFIQVMIIISPGSSKYRNTSMSSSIEYMGQCKCSHESQPDEIQKSIPLHYRMRQEDASIVFDKFWTTMASALSYRQTHKIRLPGVSISPSSPRKKYQELWPVQASDLLPHPYATSFESMLDWPDSSSSYCKFICLAVDSFRAELIPVMLRKPTAQDWLRYASDVAGYRLSGERTESNYAELCANVQYTCHAFLTFSEFMFEDELKAWWTSGNTVDPAQTVKDLESCCSFAYTFSWDARMINSTFAKTERIWRDMEGAIQRIAGLLLHILDLTDVYAQDLTKPRGLREDDGIQDILRLAASTWIQNMRHPHAKLLRLGYGEQWNGRCHAPACLATRVSHLGRRFPVCQGCKHAAYCSRRCQKTAWTHEVAPHRELCSVSAIVNSSKSKSQGSALRFDVEKRITTQQASAACSNIEALIALKTKHTFERAGLDANGGRTDQAH